MRLAIGPVEAHGDEIVLRRIGRLLLLDRLAVVEPRAVAVPERLRVELHRLAEIHRGHMRRIAAARRQPANLEEVLVLRLLTAKLQTGSANDRQPIS